MPNFAGEKHFFLPMKKHFFYVALCALCCLSCGKKNSFTVEGEITDAAGKMLYLQHAGLLEDKILDSVRLTASGNFHFRQQRPPYPDLYRLILDGKFIVFALDSTETLYVRSQYAGFALNYTIENSPQSIDIQTLRRSLAAAQAIEEPQARLSALLAHKDSAKALILRDARSLAAYFALHQQTGGKLLFSPYEKDDQPYYNAVATAFHVFMPDYSRSKALYANATDAIKRRQEERENLLWQEIVEKNGVGFIDIALPDAKGKQRTLSSLVGHCVLLDFSAFSLPESAEYTFLLRDLYNKYAKRGFTIFQVSLDNSRLLWEDASEHLPWICVRDSAQTAARTYNVQQIPTLFLLDKQGNIVNRITDIKTLDSQINNLLK